MSIAFGPLGRNGEASGSLNTSGKVAAMYVPLSVRVVRPSQTDAAAYRYSYSKTRGLFGGVSVEGSVIVERQDANTLAYESTISAKQLLSGAIDPPEWASPLIKTLEACTGMPGGRKWVQDGGGEMGYAFGNGLESPNAENGPPSLSTRKKRSLSSQFPPAAWGRRKSSGSYFSSELAEEPPTATGPPLPLPNHSIHDSSATKAFDTQFESDFNLIDDGPSKHPNLTARSPHSSSFNPGSPFNDLPPFPNAGKSAPNHLRSSSYQSSSRTNPFSSDPFSSFEASGRTKSQKPSLTVETSPKPYIAPKTGLTAPLKPHEGVGRAIALFDFKAVEVLFFYSNCNAPSYMLPFSLLSSLAISRSTRAKSSLSRRRPLGQMTGPCFSTLIILHLIFPRLHRWTGKVDGREGIFPANFVEVV